MTTSSADFLYRYTGDHGEIECSMRGTTWNGIKVPGDTIRRAWRLFHGKPEDRLGYIDNWMFYQSQKPVPNPNNN